MKQEATFHQKLHQVTDSTRILPSGRFTVGLTSIISPNGERFPQRWEFDIPSNRRSRIQRNQHPSSSLRRCCVERLPFWPQIIFRTLSASFAAVPDDLNSFLVVDGVARHVRDPSFQTTDD